MPLLFRVSLAGDVPVFLAMPGQAGVPLMAMAAVAVCGAFRDEGVAPSEMGPALDQACFGAHGAPFWTRWPMHTLGAGMRVLRAHNLGLTQHGVQQHIATGFDVLGLGVFDFVVADAVFAGDEDHAAGGQSGGVDRIVARA